MANEKRGCSKKKIRLLQLFFLLYFAEKNPVKKFFSKKLKKIQKKLAICKTICYNIKGYVMR